MRFVSQALIFLLAPVIAFAADAALPLKLVPIKGQTIEWPDKNVPVKRIIACRLVEELSAVEKAKRKNTSLSEHLGEQCWFIYLVAEFENTCTSNPGEKLSVIAKTICGYPETCKISLHDWNGDGTPELNFTCDVGAGSCSKVFFVEVDGYPEILRTVPGSSLSFFSEGAEINSSGIRGTVSPNTIEAIAEEKYIYKNGAFKREKDLPAWQDMNFIFLKQLRFNKKENRSEILLRTTNEALAFPTPGEIVEQHSVVCGKHIYFLSRYTDGALTFDRLLMEEKWRIENAANLKAGEKIIGFSIPAEDAVATSASRIDVLTENKDAETVLGKKNFAETPAKKPTGKPPFLFFTETRR